MILPGATFRNLTRISAILISIFMQPTETWAQTESWKIFLRASGTWSALRGVEIDSTGTLVTHEGETERMPRCASLARLELDYLSERVTEARLAGDEIQRDWGTTILDVDIAQLTIVWPASEKIIRVGMPLAEDMIDGSPPRFLVELIQQSWRLRESAEARCRA